MHGQGILVFHTTFTNIDSNSATTCCTIALESTVLIGHGVVEDATAYLIQTEKLNTRLLLGHTTSILTEIHAASPGSSDVVCSSKQILECDCNQKIHVSHLPQTHTIHKFCLGHNTFDLAMDIVTDINIHKGNKNLKW